MTKKSFEYTLNEAVTIAKNGKEEKATKLVINAPISSQYDDVDIMECFYTRSMQAYFKSETKDLAQQELEDLQSQINELRGKLKSESNKIDISEKAEEAQEEDSEEAQIDYILQCITSGANEKDRRGLNATLKTLVCGRSTINGVELKRSYFDLIDRKDRKNILGRYIYYFLS